MPAGGPEEALAAAPVEGLTVGAMVTVKELAPAQLLVALWLLQGHPRLRSQRSEARSTRRGLRGRGPAAPIMNSDSFDS